MAVTTTAAGERATAVALARKALELEAEAARESARMQQDEKAREAREAYEAARARLMEAEAPYAERVAELTREAKECRARVLELWQPAWPTTIREGGVVVQRRVRADVVVHDENALLARVVQIGVHATVVKRVTWDTGHLRKLAQLHQPPREEYEVVSKPSLALSRDDAATADTPSADGEAQ